VPSRIRAARIELISELEQVEAQRDEYLDDLRRAHADFENYRKRVARDGAVQREQGRGDVVSRAARRARRSRPGRHGRRRARRARFPST
jgi:hypothetical protein